MKRFIASLFAIALLSVPATAHPAFPWCGWYMRQVEHVSSVKYNRSLEWLNYGHPISSPQVGAIAIWNYGRGRGHVGKIVGRTAKGWVVLSGNDGGRVRTRVRDVSRAQFRIPSSMFGML